MWQVFTVDQVEVKWPAHVVFLGYLVSKTSLMKYCQPKKGCQVGAHHLLKRDPLPCYMLPSCRRTYSRQEQDSLVAVSALWRCPSHVMSQSNVSPLSHVSPMSLPNCPRFMFILSVTAAVALWPVPAIYNTLLSKQICFKCCATIENGQLLLLQLALLISQSNSYPNIYQ